MNYSPFFEVPLAGVLEAASLCSFGRDITMKSPWRRGVSAIPEGMVWSLLTHSPIILVRLMRWNSPRSKATGYYLKTSLKWENDHTTKWPLTNQHHQAELVSNDLIHKLNFILIQVSIFGCLNQYWAVGIICDMVEIGACAAFDSLKRMYKRLIPLTQFQCGW